VNFSIYISGVCLYGAGLYAQNFSDAAIRQTLADQFCNLPFTRRQIIPVLNVYPLFLVEQYDIGLLARRITASRILRL
jgi:hypothetical protein